MNNSFCGPIAAELRGFLRFKRDLWLQARGVHPPKVR
jgi:hypothetical protein